MRLSIFLIIGSFMLIGCSGNSGSVRKAEKEMKIFRAQVISIAEKYVTDQLQDTAKITDANGIIKIGNDQKRFIIDPANIITGFIDADKSTDAIIPVFPFEGQYEVTTQHLFITGKNGKYMLEVALETDMKVISVRDGIITADVPEHSRNNPLFNCSSCWEVVRYRLINGELVKVE